MLSTATLFIALMVLAGVAAQASPTPDLGQIPQACLTAGTTLQAECAATFTEASAFFNVTPGTTPPPSSITQQQISAYLAQAKPPSPGCCKVACEFNNNFCSCERAVVDFAATLTGNAEIFSSIGQAFATACRFKPFIAATCPAPALRATTPKDACPAAAGR